MFSGVSSPKLIKQNGINAFQFHSPDRLHRTFSPLLHKVKNQNRMTFFKKAELFNNLTLNIFKLGTDLLQLRKLLFKENSFSSW